MKPLLAILLVTLAGALPAGATETDIKSDPKKPVPNHAGRIISAKPKTQGGKQVTGSWAAAKSGGNCSQPAAAGAPSGQVNTLEDIYAGNGVELQEILKAPAVATKKADPPKKN